MTRYLLAVVVIAVIGLAASMRVCTLAQKERDRLSDNQRVLFSRIEFYKTKDSLSAASVGRLVLTKKELEMYNIELVARVKDLELKVKRVRSLSSTAMGMDVEITAPVEHASVVVGLNPTCRG